MSQVLYLKATDRESLIAALEAAGMWADGAYKKRYQGDELYEQGTLYAPTGNMIQTDMGEVPEKAPIPGYHATLCLFGEVPDDLEAIRVIPNNPQLRLGGWKSPAEIEAEEQMRMAL